MEAQRWIDLGGRFSRPVTNGQCFRIECSTDLVTWSELCTTEVTENAIHYADADGPGVRTRFYRAIPVPCPADGL